MTTVLRGGTPLRAGGPVSIEAAVGGSATSGASRADGDGGTALAVTLGRLASLVDLGSSAVSGSDVLVTAARGPPAAGATASAPTTAPTSTTDGTLTVDLTTRTATVRRSAAVVTAPTGRVTIADDDSTTAIPTQQAYSPLPGSVLVLAALGGTLGSGGATLTFAPGSLRADAWVTIDSHVGPVDGLRTTSAIYDLHAYDARTGAVIATFAVAPVLTVQVGAAAAVSGIYYLAADGTVQRQATTYDPATGVVTAALPHFSSYVTGSPLDGVIAFIVPQLQAWLATVPSTFPATYTFGAGMTLAPGVTLAGVTLTLDAALSGSGPYTGTVTISASVTLDLTVGSTQLTGTGTLGATYTLSSQALDAGVLALSVTGFALTMRSGGTVVATVSPTTATLDADRQRPHLRRERHHAHHGRPDRHHRRPRPHQPRGHRRPRPPRHRRRRLPHRGLAHRSDGLLHRRRRTQRHRHPRPHRRRAEPHRHRGRDLRRHHPHPHGQRAHVTAGTTAQSIRLTAGSGTLTRTSAGLVGTLTGTVAASGFVAGTGTGTLAVDTTASTPSVTVLLALRDVTLFLGQGAPFDADGAVSTTAHGVLVSGATVGLLLRSSGSRTDYTLDAQGDVALVGVPGVTASGHLRARVNTATSAVDQTVAFADGSGSVALVFTDGTSGSALETGTSSLAFTSFSSTGLTLSVLGQSFTADAVVTTTSTGVSVALANLTVVVQSQGTTVARFAQTGAAGSLTLGGTAATGSLTGTLTLLVPGLAVNGTISLDVLTSSVATDPQHVTLTGSALDVTVAGQVIHVDTFGLARVSVGGVTTTSVTVSGGHLAVTQGTTTLLDVSAVSGSLALTAAGVTGRLTATVTTTVGGLAFGSSVRLAVNTGTAAVGDLPAGPYARVEVVGATVTVGGQSFSADLVLVRGVDATGATVLRVAVNNATLAVTAGGTTVVSLSAGAGAILVTQNGIAAQVRGTVAVTLPDVQLAGTLELRVNTTGAAVDDSVRVGDTDVPVVVAAGTGAYLRLAGTGMVLTVAGQTLTGDVTVEKSSGVVTVSLAQGALSLGGGLVSVTGATAALTAGATGLYGSFTGTVAVQVPGVAVAGTVTVQVNTSDTAQGALAAHTLRAGGTSIVVTVGGVDLTGEIWFERVAGSADASTYRLDLVSAGLSLGAFATISGANGTVVFGPDGVAGSVSATATLTVPGVTFSTSTMALQVNTSTAPVVLDTTTTLPAGPYLRVALTGATVTVGSLGSLTGSFTVQRSVAADGSTETVLAMTGATATLGSSSTASLFNGSGVLVLRSGGVAGYLSGTASASTSGLTMSGSVLLQVDTIVGQAVATTVVVGGTTLAVTFPSSPSPVFSLSVSNASLTIGDFVSIEGSVTFRDVSLTLGGAPVQAQVFAGTGLTVFLGRGPARLDTGAINPLAVGVLLTDARIGLIAVGGGYALTASGTVSIIGVAGVTLVGTTSVQVNTTGYAVSQTIDIPGSTDPGVAVTYASAAAVKSFQVTGATLAYGGLSLSGDLAFTRDGTDVVATVTNASVALGGAVRSPPSRAPSTSGSAGLTASLSAHVAVTALGLNLDGSLALNTTAAPATLTVGTSTVSLPAGPYLRASVTGASLSILGQSLAADVTLERATAADGSVTTRIALANVTFSLSAGTGSTQSIGIDHGQGLLVITASGLAGQVSGHVTTTLGSALSITGTLGLTVNTTAAAVSTSLTVGGVTQTLTVAAGPYLRFEGTGLTLTVLGQTLTGDVAIEKATPLLADGTVDTSRSVLRLTAANVSLSLGGATPVVSLTQGTAVLLLTGTTVAGRVTGTLAVTIPQVSLTGDLAVEVNTGTTGVNETFRVGGAAPVTLVLPAAGTGGPYVQVRGTGVTLVVLGQRLSGDVTITRTVSGGTPTLAITTANLVLALGGTPSAPLLTATQVAGTTGTFTVTSTGVTVMTGSVSVTVALAVPNVALTGTVTIAFDTAASTFSLGGTAQLVVSGQSLSGTFALDQQSDTTGARVVRIGVTGGTLALGPAGSPVVSAQNATGAFVVGPAGVAGSLEATIAMGSGTPVTISGAVQVQLNTTGAAVDQTVTVGAATLGVQLPAGPYLRIAGTGVTVTLNATQTLTADVAVERTVSYGADHAPGGGDDSTVVRIAATNVALALGDGTRTLVSLTNGSAAFLLPAGGGLAGRITGTLTVTGVPGVSLSATVDALVNTTTGAVDEAFTVGGAVLTVTVPASTTFRITATGVSLASS